MYIVDKWRIIDSNPDNTEKYPHLINDELKLTFRIPYDKVHVFGYKHTQNGYERGDMEISNEVLVALVLDVVSKKFKNYITTPDYADVMTFILKHKNKLLKGKPNREEAFLIESILEIRKLLFHNCVQIWDDKEKDIENNVY
jgi:hypothetical protein